MELRHHKLQLRASLLSHKKNVVSFAVCLQALDHMSCGFWRIKWGCRFCQSYGDIYQITHSTSLLQALYFTGKCLYSVITNILGLWLSSIKSTCTGFMTGFFCMYSFDSIFLLKHVIITENYFFPTLWKIKRGGFSVAFNWYFLSTITGASQADRIGHPHWTQQSVHGIICNLQNTGI